MASRPLRLAGWLAVAAVTVALDYLLGPLIQFPAFYLVPVALCAWFDGALAGLLLAVGLPLVRLYLMWHWDFPLGVETAVINASIRSIVLCSFAVVIDRTARQTRELAREVQVLEGLLPICAHCKKIRDEDEQWQQLERFISRRSSARFTHGVCPECRTKHYEGAGAAQRP